MEEDPQILWRRIGAGDRQAFTALYQSHQEDVLRFCQALLRDPDDAREAANSTWVAVWRSRDAAQRDVPLRPWLFRIARNEAIDAMRRRRPHEQLDIAMPAPDDTVAEAELHERLATLHEDLLTLTEHQRTALVLREMSGLSHEEIATVLDISSGAAKQTIYEARQALVDAEGGRTLSCDLIRRDISAGDRRVLRNRRVRAHLRTCAACREFADAVEAQRGHFRALLPAPLGVALLARFRGPADEVIAGGGGAGATAGLSAVGAKLGGPVAAKVAAGALAVVVGGGAAGAARLPADRHAATHRPAVVHAVIASAPRQVAAAADASQTSRVAHPARSVSRPSVPTRTPAAAAPRATDGSGRARAQATVSAKVNAGAAPPPTATDAGTPSAAKPVTTVPPGQAKKSAAQAVPPGQAKKDPSAGAPAVPPGQAKKDPAPSAAPAVPPGQAKKDPAPSAAPAVPPGQAKKDPAPSAA